MANVITVSALNAYVRTLLDRDPVLTDIALRGEIANFVHHFKTGHFYFSLRDEACSVKAVMFRGNAQRLPFEPENGMRVIVRCRVSLFERDGSFQVYVEDMFPDGIGAMQLAFEQLKARLAKEGLFDEAHKRPLPAVPRCVGLVTSKTGAAIQDIFNVTRRRWPGAHFLLCPVTVQGAAAALEIAAAIRTLDESGRTDVIIVARGGGSREDLWVFNDERIARAAYASSTPVVSAVGHEIDFSILDFVADLRAPTPSAAAELVMPDGAAMLQKTDAVYTNICKEIQKRLTLCYNHLQEQRESTAFARMRALPARREAETRQKAQDAHRLLNDRLARADRTLRAQAALTESLSPLRVLARGYSVARRDGAVLRDAAAVCAGDSIAVQLYRGALDCRVERVQKETEGNTDGKNDL